MYTCVRVCLQQEYSGQREDEYVCHGNIRCRNVFVFSFDASTELKVKLGDSGMVDVYSSLPLRSVQNEERLPWVAPEQIDRARQSKYSTKFADIYSFGVFLCELFSQERPFKDLSLRQVTCNLCLILVVTSNVQIT